MNEQQQTTLMRGVAFEGVGVHGGQMARAVIRPAPSHFGIQFRRIDVTEGDNLIPALYDQVVDTRLCTRIENAAGASVGTIEHLMAALAGCGVDNALIEIDGPEIPIMDGSAAPFAAAIMRAGMAYLNAPRRVIRILEDVEIAVGCKLAALRPARCFEMEFDIDFADAAIGVQSLSMVLANDAFVEDLARARTFGRFEDVEMLRKLGLGLGGSLDSAVIVDGARVLNPGGLRYKDEFVRHKMLDAVGDLALAGAPIIGRYTGCQAGHALTNMLLRALFARPSAWRVESVALEDAAAMMGADVFPRTPVARERACA